MKTIIAIEGGSMKRSKLDKAYEHISGIYRNYPDWPSTFGGCITENCNNLARGSGFCAYCHEKELAKYAGDKPARNFHNEVKATNKAFEDLVNTIRWGR